jgi:hypothetical protein
MKTRLRVNRSGASAKKRLKKWLHQKGIWRIDWRRHQARRKPAGGGIEMKKGHENSTTKKSKVNENSSGGAKTDVMRFNEMKKYQ